MRKISKMNHRFWLAPLLCGAAFAVSAHGEDAKLIFSGAGWTQYGMIVKSLDTTENKATVRTMECGRPTRANNPMAEMNNGTAVTVF